MDDHVERSVLTSINQSWLPSSTRNHEDYSRHVESIFPTVSRWLTVRPGGVEKLVPNLHNKTKYILYHRNLKLYFELGIKLTKIQQVLQFQQAAWLKPYIDLNTQKRSKREMLWEGFLQIDQQQRVRQDDGKH